MSDDVVSAEEAEKELAHVQDMIGAEGVAAYPWYVRERLARTVVTLHRELAALRAQLPPLCAVHDALDAAESLRPRDPHRTGHRCACCGREGAPEADALCPWCSEGRAAERERDDARAEVETLRAEAALLREQFAAMTARVEELEESAARACQSPADDCDCAGCLYAAERGGES
jgi:hypothetical protein